MNHRKPMKATPMTDKKISAGSYSYIQTSGGKDNDPDHVYYNVIINNTGTTLKAANFSETRTFPILNKQSDYYLTVPRFSVPALAIPMFTFVDNTYSVTLQYNATISQTYLTYTSNNTGTAKTIDSYQQMLDSINTAFQTSFTALGVLPTATEAPYMIYEPSTQLFSLVAQKALVTDGVSVYFNQALALLFPLFNYIVTIPIGSGTSGKDSKIVIQDQKNNSYLTNYWKMDQSGPSFWSWPSWSGIVFTGNVGTNKELYNSVTTPGSNDFKLQISDFEIDVLSAQDPKSLIVYAPAGPYRLIDMVQDSALVNFNLNVSYIDKLTGELTQLYLYPGQVLTVKILFRKKSLGA